MNKKNIGSKAINYLDFKSGWYKHWAKELKQTKEFVENPIHNKFWQNAAIIESINENGLLKSGTKAIGFGVGNERVPAMLAKHSIYVTATDQDPETGKQKGWDNGQLAHGLNSLNKFGICTKAQQNKYIEYRQNDMNKIKKSFFGKYDIVWSNCALGHLGGIPQGLNFIENSLMCLKPGGIAVHTTELNIISNERTLDSGGTVLFRAKDLEALFFRLRKKGFKCELMKMNLGSTKEDMNVSFEPYPENNLLKLSVLGYVMSQIIVTIRKPENNPMSIERYLGAYINLLREKYGNFRNKKVFLEKNQKLKKYTKLQGSAHLTNKLRVVDTSVQKYMKYNGFHEVEVTIKNGSTATFFDFNTSAYNTAPLSVATDEPVNRNSKLYTNGWFSKNRPSTSFYKKNNRSDYACLSPGGECSYRFLVRTADLGKLKDERFCLVLEGLGKVPGSDFIVSISS
jgi:hypothetical protein